MNRRDRILLALGARLAGWVIRIMHRLMRWATVNERVVLSLHREGRPYVHAFFHDQLLMMTYSYLGRSYGRRLAVLASRHRDGEYVSRTLQTFGHVMVRGSSGRGGMAGLRDMVRRLRSGQDAAFAIDGPRGPRHTVQMGAVEAARLARVPIVPVAFGASKKKLSPPGTPSRSLCRSGAASSLTASRSGSPRMPAARPWRRCGGNCRRRSSD